MSNGKMLMVMVALVWVGMMLAIGMESIVKFNAPTLTKPVGFDVGRTVFGVFNYLQLGLLAIVVNCAFFVQIDLLKKILIASAGISLCLQVFWLFPELSQRVDLILKGIKPPPTYQHALYGMLEIFKLAVLSLFGILLLRLQAC